MFIFVVYTFLLVFLTVLCVFVSCPMPLMDDDAQCFDNNPFFFGMCMFPITNKVETKKFY
jgi:hypothetical protein